MHHFNNRILRHGHDVQVALFIYKLGCRLSENINIKIYKK